MGEIVAFQDEFRQALPNVTGNVDYKIFRETLARITELIKLSKIDRKVMAEAVRLSQEEYNKSRQTEGKRPKQLTNKEKLRIQQRARRVLRCGIARHLTGDAYREFSCRLADSALLQNFCLIDRLHQIKVPSKSKLQRDEALFEEGFLREVISEVTRQAAQTSGTEEDTQVMGLEEAVSLEQYFLDTTCLKANIHFPVDWVLLRDATRTLMKAVRLIRAEGLLNRMQDPQTFIGQMNRLSIQMTHTRRQKDGKRGRKKVLRLMKKLVGKVARHAELHRDLLINRREETCFTENQAHQIIFRIDSVLEQLPQAVCQAHERIIGERQVPNRSKILSLYEKDIHVIVRGKADAEAEFGNTLLLGEQLDGIILDWELYREKSSSDSKLLKQSLERIDTYHHCRPSSVTTDRGFDSPANRRYLEKAGIGNNICPKSVPALQEKMQQASFCENQKRRGQTEGRIGILKNEFLGNPLKSKGFASRQMSVAWAVLAHNLWVIARLPRAQDERNRHQQAA
jgi:hypothetical protein